MDRDIQGSLGEICLTTFDGTLHKTAARKISSQEDHAESISGAAVIDDQSEESRSMLRLVKSAFS